MRYTIEPMSMGDIFSRATNLLLSRVALFAAIEAIVVAPTLGLQLAFPEFANGPASLGLSFLILLFGSIGSAAMLHVITREYLGEAVSLRQAFQFALGRFLPLLTTTALAYAGIIFGIVACIIPGIYLAIIWAFSSQVVVMENVSWREALGRSKRLVEGYFWHVFGVLFVVGFVVTLIASVLDIGLRTALPIQDPDPGPFAEIQRVDNYLNYAFIRVIETVVNGVSQTFIAICTTLLYFDVRNRKEAFDMSHIVVWMSQYRDWRDEPVPSDAQPAMSTETNIKLDANVPSNETETGIQTTNAPRPGNSQ